MWNCLLWKGKDWHSVIWSVLIWIKNALKFYLFTIGITESHPINWKWFKNFENKILNSWRSDYIIQNLCSFKNNTTRFCIPKTIVGQLKLTQNRKQPKIKDSTLIKTSIYGGLKNVGIFSKIISLQPEATTGGVL